MGYPIRDNDRGPRRSFDRRSSGGDRGVRRPEMHKTTCSSCGKECEVPFRPTGERPVYCRDCFAKNGGGERRENFGRDNRDSRDPRPPFRTFNNDSRGPRPEPHAHPAPQAPHTRHDEQFAAINAKLDKLITLLTAHAPKPKEEKVTKEAAAPVEKEKVVTKKKKTTKKLVKTSDA